jgi:hypothetical protein
MLPVGLVRGIEGFVDACPGLVVQLADLGVQVGDDGPKLSASFGKARVLGDRC